MVPALFIANYIIEYSNEKGLYGERSHKHQALMNVINNS